MCTSLSLCLDIAGSGTVETKKLEHDNAPTLILRRVRDCFCATEREVERERGTRMQREREEGGTQERGKQSLVHLIPRFQLLEPAAKSHCLQSPATFKSSR